MFVQYGMYDLLVYLKYLVDTMRAHNVVWGVGRGSSVASFVLYKMGVHRINSLYYDLDPAEFLK
jgi:DNA polymerase III alpha subunit